MLTQFSVRNYKSIQKVITLDMQAIDVPEQEESVIKGKDGYEYLPVAAIFGPNGAGKSNVLESLRLLVATVCNPVWEARNEKISDKKIVAFPFLFAEETMEMPTEFELFFQGSTAEYRYRFALKGDRILYEALSRKVFGTEEIEELYGRRKNQIWKNGGSEKVDLTIEIPDQLPFLSYLAITGKDTGILREATDCFLKQIQIAENTESLKDLKNFFNEETEGKSLMVKHLKNMDTQIVDFRIEEKPGNSVQVRTVHKIGEKFFELNLSDESAGIRKLFWLLPKVIHCLRSGGTLIVDQPDIGLHPLWIRYLVCLFRDPKVNQKHAQMIFTAHDVTLLHPLNLRRDEIWFVAKGVNEDTSMYALAEFKQEKGNGSSGENTRIKQYLVGRYGAIPSLKNCF